MAMKIYVGENCHADVVVDGADRGELGALSSAKELAATTGMIVFPDSFIGHFSIRGAAYEEDGHPLLTQGERLALEQIGEVIELSRLQQDIPLAA